MQDSQSAGPKPASRRGFFFGAASVGAAAAAVTVLPKVAPEPVSAATPVPKPAPEKGGGYTLSEHVKHYYKTTSA
ncbi:formate dehydrogenase [Variovorax sp. LjRoot290]|uniref:formate dehydrogenase n=1 Tax=unclassified Variovorax TaxID=663243 RepID=UPI000891B287|nr:formate dehydrogenase [Variovorax sp. CF079]SDD08598.1 formate dehydrogenase region TAT target [Variovorax sp. CF079]